MSAPAVDAPDALSHLIPSKVARGFLLAIVAGLFFTGLNASAKELAQEMPPLLVSWGRWVVAVLLIAPCLWWRFGLAGMRTRDLKLHALRGLFHTPGYGLWYEAVAWLPLATMSALGFTGPIFVTLGAVIFLRETVHWRRWLAVGVGFAGMLVIVRPRAEGFHGAAWLVLLSALAYALMMLLARWMTRPQRPHESTSSFVFYMLAGQAVAGWLVALGSWRSPDARSLVEMAAMGVFGILGNYGLAEAFRRAPVALVAPFEYTGLVWAVVLGAVVFGDVPRPTFWLGAAIIVGAGLYTLRADPA